MFHSYLSQRVSLEWGRRRRKFNILFIRQSNLAPGKIAHYTVRILILIQNWLPLILIPIVIPTYYSQMSLPESLPPHLMLSELQTRLLVYLNPSLLLLRLDKKGPVDLLQNKEVHHAHRSMKKLKLARLVFYTLPTGHISWTVRLSVCVSHF